MATTSAAGDDGRRVDAGAETGRNSWEDFQQARRELAEVMSDDELRDLGVDVDELDRQP